MGRLTDYGVVLMAYMAGQPDRLHNAAEVAAGTQLRPPTVSKLMRLLARRGLLVSQRGVKGGFSLARPPAQITLAEVVRALEGPVSMTVCTGEQPRACEHETLCPVRAPWQRINRVILGALDSVTLADMAGSSAYRSLPLAVEAEARPAAG
jgi:FeS assembly SUF system regulator